MRKTSYLRADYEHLYTMWKRMVSYARKNGIEVCAEWQHPDQFISWAIETRPSEAHVFRRGATMSPGDCGWWTRAELSASLARKYTAFGKTKSLREFADDPQCPVSIDCLRQRVEQLGWPMELAISSAVGSIVRRYHEKQRFSYYSKTLLPYTVDDRRR